MRHLIMDVLGWWGLCFCGYAVCSVVLKLWKRYSARIRQKSNGVSHYGPVFFASCVCIVLVLGSTRIRLNVVTQHNVAVIQQLTDGDWLMSSDEDKSLVFRPCPEDTRSGVDVNGILKAGTGYIAEHAIWEEQGNCKSILKPELGFWFKAEANRFTYQRIN